MRVLITSASRKVWLIKAFKRALLQEGGGQVVAADADQKAPALRFADYPCLVPRGLGSDFVAAVNQICLRYSVKLIVPTRDEELPFFARLRESLEAHGITVLLPDLHVIETCQDKRAFPLFCSGNGFSVPRTYDSGAPEAVEKFPVFVKARCSKASASVAVAQSEEQLRFITSRFHEPVVQEYITAPEYTIDIFLDSEGVVISAVPRERLSVVDGESFIGRTAKNWTIINEVVRLATIMGLRGHNTAQCFLDKGAVKFIEVNPRYGGGANLGFAAGAFTPRYAVRLAQGKPVEPALGDFQDRLFMLRYTDDVFLSEEELTHVERFN